MTDTAHQERILDQFTRQATPFSTANTITDANALRMIVTAAAPTRTIRCWMLRAGAASWSAHSLRTSGMRPAST